MVGDEKTFFSRKFLPSKASFHQPNHLPQETGGTIFSQRITWIKPRHSKARDPANHITFPVASEAHLLGCEITPVNQPLRKIKRVKLRMKREYIMLLIIWDMRPFTCTSFWCSTCATLILRRIKGNCLYSQNSLSISCGWICEAKEFVEDFTSPTPNAPKTKHLYRLPHSVFDGTTE